jgi:hypothetical protein
MRLSFDPDRRTPCPYLSRSPRRSFALQSQQSAERPLVPPSQVGVYSHETQQDEKSPFDLDLNHTIAGSTTSQQHGTGDPTAQGAWHRAVSRRCASPSALVKVMFRGWFIANLLVVSKSLDISHAHSGESDIVLIPQPSDCGRDPLVRCPGDTCATPALCTRVDRLLEMAEVEEVLPAILGSTVRLCLLLWREHLGRYATCPLVYPDALKLILME